MKFGYNLPSSFRGEPFGRTTELAYTISSPGAFGSGVLKMLKQQIGHHNFYTCLKLLIKLYIL